MVNLFAGAISPHSLLSLVWGFAAVDAIIAYTFAVSRPYCFSVFMTCYLPGSDYGMVSMLYFRVRLNALREGRNRHGQHFGQGVSVHALDISSLEN